MPVTLNGTDGIVTQFGSKIAGNANAPALKILHSGSETPLLINDGDDPNNTFFAVNPSGNLSINNTSFQFLENDLYVNKNKLTQKYLNIDETTIGQNWSSGLFNAPWQSVAMSSDGKYQTVVASEAVILTVTGLIYISSDYGSTWAPAENYRYWSSVAMSADGKYQTATVVNGQIYTSSNYGVTWTPKQANREWRSVAMSADGRYQTATVRSGLIYISSDYGNTWMSVESARLWSSITMSTDGKYQTATVDSSGLIYTSSNYGVNWTPRSSNKDWLDVAMSADGKYQTAVAYNNLIYTSYDYGVTWIQRTSTDKLWYGVTMSANGKYQVAVADIDYVYISIDYGITWTPKHIIAGWSKPSISADGGYLTVAGYSVNIYTSRTSIKSQNISVLKRPRNVYLTDNRPTTTLAANTPIQSHTFALDKPTVVEVLINNVINSINRVDTQLFVDGVLKVQTLTPNISLIPTAGNLQPVRLFWVGELQSGTHTIDYSSTTANVVGGITLPGASPWTARDSARFWNSVAISSNGQYQIATVDNGQLYKSTNYGTSWTAIESVRAWRNVAMSADSKYQTAVANNNFIYISSDYGTNWLPKGLNKQWRGIAISSTGKYQIACAQGDEIYTSYDFGNTWTARTFLNSTGSWFGVAISQDGRYQTAVKSPGNIFTSSDYGVTWTSRAGARSWNAVAMSSTGQYQTAVDNSSGGFIWVSNDFGINWNFVSASFGAPPAGAFWKDIAMSTNGRYQTAVANGPNQVYMSSDFGVTWVARDVSRAWIGIAMSEDGKYQTGVVFNSQIYTASPGLYRGSMSINFYELL